MERTFSFAVGAAFASASTALRARSLASRRAEASPPESSSSCASRSMRADTASSSAASGSERTAVFTAHAATDGFGSLPTSLAVSRSPSARSFFASALRSGTKRSSGRP